jgi:fucose permease
MNGIAWFSITTATDTIKDIYQISEYKVILVNLLHFILFPIGVIFAVMYYNKFGLRTGLMIGAALQAVGAIIKWFVHFAFDFILVGQSFVAIAQTFIIITPALLANRWFEDSKRGIVISFGLISLLIGVGFGFLFHSYFFPLDKDEIHQSKDRILVANLIQAGIMTFIAVLTALTFKK